MIFASYFTWFSNSVKHEKSQDVYASLVKNQIGLFLVCIIEIIYNYIAFIDLSRINKIIKFTIKVLFCFFRLDKDMMKNKKQVCDILRLLSTISGDIRINTKCIYSDGISKTYILINIYNSITASAKGEIIMQQETGKLQKGFYKNMVFERGSDIIDVLLDIYNFEIQMKKNINSGIS